MSYKERFKSWKLNVLADWLLEDPSKDIYDFLNVDPLSHEEMLEVLQCKNCEEYRGFKKIVFEYYGSEEFGPIVRDPENEKKLDRTMIDSLIDEKPDRILFKKGAIEGWNWVTSYMYPVVWFPNKSIYVLKEMIGVYKFQDKRANPVQWLYNKLDRCFREIVLE